MGRVAKLWCSVVIGALCLPGCALTGLSPAKEEAPETDERSAELFEQRCDDAMLKASLARWNDGDVAGCRMLLERLLVRSPSHLEARFLLADLHASQGNMFEAENQLRTIIQHNPHNPQAHHSLGMLLETSGRRPEALPHLQTAARLEPENLLYVMCQNAAMGQATENVTRAPSK